MLSEKTVWFTIFCVSIVGTELTIGCEVAYNFVAEAMIPIMFFSFVFHLIYLKGESEIREEKRKKDNLRRVTELERREQYDDYMIRAKVALDLARKNNVPIPIIN